MAKQSYKDRMPYDRKDFKFWVPMEHLKKLDKYCKLKNISKTTILCRLIAQLTHEVELQEDELAAIEAEKRARKEAGFYVPREQNDDY